MPAQGFLEEKTSETANSDAFSTLYGKKEILYRDKAKSVHFMSLGWGAFFRGLILTFKNDRGSQT